MNYWLIKSEAASYSIDDLARDKKTGWSGVRNYQARNFMKAMKKGDLLLYYHSGGDAPSVVGMAEVSKEAHTDETALDPKSNYYNPKSTKTKPIWEMVEVKFIKKLAEPITLTAIKQNKKLKGIMLAEQGSRLSVQPVSQEHFSEIEWMGR